MSDGGVGLADVEWCVCSAVVEEGRVANERAWVVVVDRKCNGDEVL